MKRKSPKKEIVPIYAVPDYLRSLDQYRRSLPNEPYASPKTHERRVQELANQMIQDTENGTFKIEKYDKMDLPERLVQSANRKKNLYMIEKYRPKSFRKSPRKNAIDSMAAEMAREIINNMQTKKKFNMKKYLDRSRQSNKRDVYVAKGKAHQLVKKYQKDVMFEPHGPQSKYKPPRYDPEDPFLPGTAFPGFYEDDLALLRKMPRKNLNIMPKHWEKMDAKDFEKNPHLYSQIWRQNSILPDTYPEGWYPTVAKITDSWSPGKNKMKIMRPEFMDDSDDDDYMSRASALRQMLEDYSYRQFDPNLPQSQQQNEFPVQPRVYSEALRMFKIMKGMETFEDLPEQTADNPLRSPSFDPKLNKIGQGGLKLRRRARRRNEDFANKLQNKFEDDMKKMERADLLELIRREGDDPNYNFPENFFSDAGDFLHEEEDAEMEPDSDDDEDDSDDYEDMDSDDYESDDDY